MLEGMAESQFGSPLPEEFDVSTPPAQAAVLGGVFSEHSVSPFRPRGWEEAEQHREEAEARQQQARARLAAEIGTEYRESVRRQRDEEQQPLDPRGSGAVAPDPRVDQLTQQNAMLMGMMQQLNQQNFALMQRLDRMERDQAGQNRAERGGPPLHGQNVRNGMRGFDPADSKVPFGITMPVADFKSWKGRVGELHGFRMWFESFCGWLNLIGDQYVPEIREAVQRDVPLDGNLLSPEQWSRSQRVLSLLRQSFVGCSRVENIVNYYCRMSAVGDGHGYEALRLVHRELTLQNRAEALALRSNVIQQIVRGERLMDIVRQVETDLYQYTELLHSSPQLNLGARDVSLEISEADKVVLLLRQMPQNIRLHIQLHGQSDTFEQVKNTVLAYETSTRMVQDVSGLRSLDSQNETRTDRFNKDRHQKDRYRDKSKERDKDKTGKGRGKGRGRSPGTGGKSRRDSSSSTERSPGLGKGLCFNCGKPGHVKKDCPEPRKAASGSPKSMPLVCFNCGKPGHLKKDCPQRTRRLADGPDDESEESASGEEESHLAMAMLTEPSERGVHAGGSGTKLEYLNRVPDARGEVGSPWLVDSGATSHILSRKFMSKYRILKRHDGKVDLFAANDELIANDGMMDVEVRLRTEVGERRVVRKFVLQRCLVADISFNVLSPFCLGKNGWKTVLGSEKSSHLVREELFGGKLLEVPLRLYDRAWWVHAVMDKSPKKSKAETPAPMEVDTVRSPPGILKDSSRQVEPLSVERLVKQAGLKTQEVGSFTFLLRGLKSQGVSKEPVEEQLDTSWSLEVGVSERVAESDGEEFDLEGMDPPVGESSEDNGIDLEAAELELGPGSTYAHVSRGHFPYLSSCRACARAHGKVPARRLKVPAGKSEIGADFGFLGGLRFLCIVVFYTSMIGVVPCTSNRELDLRETNLMLRELGMTGQMVELRVDGEAALSAHFRAAARLPGSPIGGLVVQVSPPGRSTGNSRAERAIQTVKCGLGSNLLFLEERFQKRLPLECSLVKHLIRYVVRTHNIHHVQIGSDMSALERMRGRRLSKKPATYPFGCRMLGQLPEGHPQRHVGERLTECVYLGPVHVGGGGFLGCLAGGSKVGEVGSGVLKFQGGRPVLPVVWDPQDVVELMEGAVASAIPQSGPQEVGPTQEGDEMDPTEGEARPNPLVNASDTPLLTPPKDWILEHGISPGCICCKQIQKEGKSHGRVHSQGCKRRYTEWTKQEEKKKGEVAAPPVPVASSVGDLGMPASGSDRVSGPSVPVEPRRESEKRKAEEELFSPEDAEGGGSAEVPMDLDLPNYDEEEMDVDSLVQQMFDRQAEAFWYRLDCRAVEYQTWFKVFAFGVTFWQGVPKDARCELSGAALESVKVRDAMELELKEMSKLEVGTILNEVEARDKAERTGTKILACRWVLSLKTDGRTRARLVTKDFRSCGLSSFKEELYAPTASLEVLRSVLALAALGNMDILTLDISVAFMHAPLPEDEVQIVQLPPSCMSLKSERMFMDLRKALNGLRKAPLFWYRELKRTVRDKLGFQETSESTVFRKVDVRGRLICVLLAYVDDLLLCGTLSVLRQVAEQLSKEYKTKLTGELAVESTGSVEFLGRKVFRSTKGGPLCLGLDSSYWDTIEAAAELKGGLKVESNPPNLKSVTIDKDQEVETSTQEAARFRSVLGKLAWFSLTCPVLLFHISWLSHYQHLPTQNGMKALLLVLRWAKSFRGWHQEFPTEAGMEWSPQDGEVVAIVDASWSIRSCAGGMILWKGSMVKAWSRRIQVPCLSSAEAELMGLTEGLKEMQGMGIFLQSMCEGLGEHQELHTWKMKMFTDSESAKHISCMQGLLRRVKHMELRVAFLQYGVEHRGLKVLFTPGISNPVDGLTKPVDRKHLDEMLLVSGLRAGNQEVQVKALGMDVLEGVGPLSSRNRQLVIQGIEKGIRQVLELSEVKAKAEVPSLGSVTLFEDKSSSDRKVHFDPTQTHGILTSRSLPRKWMKHVPALWKVPLATWILQSASLVVEVCCEVTSEMSKVCEKLGVLYLGVTKTLPIENVGPFLRMVLQRSGPIYFWLSTPCTAGCRLRYLNRLRKWPERYEAHCRVWKALGRLFENFGDRPNTLVAREWPVSCDLVHDRVYGRVAKKLNLIYYARVKRCCLDGIQKVWSIATNSEKLAEELSTSSLCSCENVKQVSYTASGFYSESVARHFVRAGLKVLSATWNEQSSN